MSKSISLFCLALIKVQEFCNKFPDPRPFLEEVLKACRADGVYDWDPDLDFVQDVYKLRSSVVFLNFDLSMEMFVYETYLNLL